MRVGVGVCACGACVRVRVCACACVRMRVRMLESSLAPRTVVAFIEYNLCVTDLNKERSLIRSPAGSYFQRDQNTKQALSKE